MSTGIVACVKRFREAQRERFDNIGPTVMIQAIALAVSLVCLVFAGESVILAVWSIGFSGLVISSYVVHLFVLAVSSANPPC
ncbi:MAG: hypothetical protein ABI643_01165 [Candidatus Doudnabacteria bacterium]